MADVVRIEGLPNDDLQWIVYWYGGVRQNPLSLEEPILQVMLRAANSAGNDERFIVRDVGITHQGLLPLGSVFHRQMHLSDEAMEMVDFHVTFDDESFTIESAWAKIDGHYVIPPFRYNLKGCAGTKVVHFHTTQSQSTLLIPCMEVFSRMYGRSRYVKQQLTNTGDFQKARDALIVPDVVPPPTDGGWGVNLQTKCINADAIYLAHLKHDRVTEARTRRISSQIGTLDLNLRSRAPPIAHLAIEPWFKGPASIRVRGKWLNEERTRFLGLRIMGFSDPEGATIFRDRQNTNKVVTGAAAFVKKNGRNFPRQEKPALSKTIHVTHRKEPGHGELPLQIDEGPMIVLGRPRDVVPVIREKANDRDDGVQLPSDSLDEFSSGGQRGRATGVGNTGIASSTYQEASGEVLEIWETLKEMEEDPHSEFVSVVAIGPDGVSYTDFPCMIPFQPRTDLDEDASKTDREWHLLVPAAGTRRCALVVDIRLRNGSGFCVIENGRRVYDTTKTEQGFRGLMFFAPQTPLASEITNLMTAIALRRGVMSEVVSDAPQPAYAYRHRKRGTSQRPAIESAMSRIEFRPPGSIAEGTEVQRTLTG